MQNSLRSCVVVTRQIFTRVIHVGTEFIRRDPISVGTIPRGKIQEQLSMNSNIYRNDNR